MNNFQIFTIKSELVQYNPCVVTLTLTEADPSHTMPISAKPAHPMPNSANHCKSCTSSMQLKNYLKYNPTTLTLTTANPRPMTQITGQSDPVANPNLIPHPPSHMSRSVKQPDCNPIHQRNPVTNSNTI